MRSGDEKLVPPVVDWVDGWAWEMGKRQGGLKDGLWQCGMMGDPRNILSISSMCVCYILFSRIFILYPVYKLLFLLFVLAAKHDLLQGGNLWARLSGPGSRYFG